MFQQIGQTWFVHLKKEYSIIIYKINILQEFSSKRTFALIYMGILAICIVIPCHVMC